MGAERYVWLVAILLMLTFRHPNTRFPKWPRRLAPVGLANTIQECSLTGVGQTACGVGVLFSIYPRLAAVAEAGMLSPFTLLVWVPAILAAPNTRLPWTAFFI